MKKLMSMLLVLALICNTLYAANASISVSTTHWSYNALTSAVDNGIMSGDTNTLRPNEALKRAEMVAMIVNATGLGLLKPAEMKPFLADISAYKDVSTKDWFYNQIAMAVKLKLTTGVSPSTMSPSGVVTREQAFTILSHFMALNTANVDTSILAKFADHNRVSAWARPSLAAMVTAGYVSGSGSKLSSASYLKPSDAMTRQEFAQLMYNLFQRNYIKNKAEASQLNNRTINGNVIVSAQEVTLSNVTVNGDVIVADGVANGNVTFDHVVINGRLIVRGGGANSIYLKESTAKNIIISKLADGGIRLHADDGSEVPFIEIQDGKDTIIIDCDVENLTIAADNQEVMVNKAVENIRLSGDKVHLLGAGSIGTVTLEKGVNQVAIDTANTQIVNQTGNVVNLTNQNNQPVAISASPSRVGINLPRTIETNVPDGSKPSEALPVPIVQYVVKLHGNGGTVVDSVLLNAGASLGDLPVPKKDNAIFVGWYTDSGLTENAISKDTQITANMDVYAAYITSELTPASNVQTVTSVMDVAVNHAVTILSSETSMTAADVKAAIILETLSEEASEFGGISVSGSGGTYTLTATNGYTTGGSYSLKLNHQALRFQGEAQGIRTYNLSVVKAEPVLNLQLNSNIQFIPASAISDVTQNGQAVNNIFAPLYEVGKDQPEQELYGTFKYLGSETLRVGNQVAIYLGTAPNARIANTDYTDQPISYVTITNINGQIISYGNTDPSEIIFTPDVLPVNLNDDLDRSTTNASITLDVSKLSFTGDAFAEIGLTEETTVDVGDFFAFYTGAWDNDQNSGAVTYAKITSVARVGTYFIVQYIGTTQSEVFSSMDMAASSELSYDQIETTVGIAQMEQEIQQQVVKSGFSDAASEFLVALATLDEETRNRVTNELGIKNFSIEKVDKSALLKPASGPNVTVKVKLSRTLQHFDGKGLRSEITVSTAIELGDDMSLTIKGTFVEEIKVKLNIDSDTEWEWKGIIPYIDDYKVTAKLDLYNYTYLALDMVLKSESSDGWSDEFNVTDTIEDLKEKTSKIEANDEVREFYELYQKMMAEEHDYFELFDVNIGEFSGGIDPLHILAYGVNVDFVVSLDANVALGSEFSYEKGTRYIFKLKVKSKSTSSKEVVLKDEEYRFNVYAMGELGVRAGIKLTLQVGFVDVKSNSVGIATEVGAYWKIWGFVNYQLSHMNDVTTTKASGASLMEIGIYLTTKFIAQIGDGKIAYNKTLSSNSWPLWNSGSQYFIYDFKYTLNPSNDDIFFKGLLPSYTLPESVFKMSQMDFKTGQVSSVTRSASDFKYTIKDDPNRIFSVSDAGVITVTPPAKGDIAKASLEITWKKAPLSFTSIPISRTFELTWDNLAGSYLISFDSNQGSNVPSIKGAYNSNVVLPLPTREGYVFAGWFTDQGTLAVPFDSDKMPAWNTKLYAKWTPGTAKYNVRHYQKDLAGEGYTLVKVDTLSASTGANVTPAVMNYTGFTSPAAKTVAVLGSGSTTIDYFYNRNVYTLTFVLDNGLSNVVSALPFGASIVAPSLVKKGYTFTGWNAAVPAAMPASNSTFTAQWALKNYSITYDLGGGSVAGNPATYNVNSSAITIVNPTKAGYTFDGWTGTGLLSATKSLVIVNGSTENRYYTATWKLSNNTGYSVYHKKEDSNGNYSMLDLEVLKGTAGTNTLAVPKVYNGFTPDAFSQQVILADETTAVEIKYTRNSHLLTFNANGGVGGSASTLKFEAPISAPTVTRTGYTFIGWDAAVLTTMPNNALTYSAQWQPNTFSIEFNKNADNATGTMSDQVFVYGVGQNLTTAAFTRTGYAFSGWNTAANGSGTAYADAAMVSNLSSVHQAKLVLYAQWTAQPSSGVFNAKYSAKYQIFDFITSTTRINGNAFDPSWGSAGSSGGHQFSDAMLSGRYFTLKETGDATKPYALYMYETDGTPVVKNVSPNLYASSLIGLSSNVNLSPACSTSLQNLYCADWAKGLVAVGTITNLWSEGLLYNSSNGFGYFISGKTAYTTTGTIVLTNRIINPTLTQLKDVSNYEAGPLLP